jgi:hypothetical protein
MHSGIIDTVVMCAAVSLTPLCSQLCRLFLRIRSYSIFEKDLFDGKKPEVENLVSDPFNPHFWALSIMLYYGLNKVFKKEAINCKCTQKVHF